MERNLLITFFKIFELKNIILMLPYVLFMRLLAMAKDVATLRFDLFSARIRAFLWIIINSAKVIRKREHTQSLRKANDKYILKMFSEQYLFKPKFIV